MPGLSRRPVLPLLPALFFLAGATWRVEYLGNAVLPGGTTATGVARAIVPGDIVEQSPVGARRTAVLLADLTVTSGGLTRTFRQGSALVDVLLGGRHARDLSASAVEFCTPSAPFWCIVDNDSDGRADRVVLPDAADAQPGPVTVAPTPYAVRTDVALPGESAVRVRYLGLSGSSAIRFRLELVEQGRAVAIVDNGARIPTDGLPLPVAFMGGLFTVTAASPHTGRITVTVQRPIPPGPYNVNLTAPGLFAGIVLGPAAPGARTLDRAPDATAP